MPDQAVKAGLYLRISLDRTGEMLGVERQEQDCRELAASLGWDVAEVYVDNDISASSGKPRPGYRKLIADIGAGTIQAIVAWAPDRLYRRIRDLEELIEVIEGNDIAVRTVKAGDLDLSSGYGRMIARILGAVAQGEGDIKGDRWRRSVRQSREAGNPPTWGPRLYGYTRAGEVIPEERDHIHEWAHHIIEGGSLRGLANEINDAEIETTLGNPWSVAALRKLLTNPRLAGHSVLQRGIKSTDKTGRTSRRYTAETVGVGKWVPILDPETFEQVRAMLTARSGRPRQPRVGLLTGIIFCGVCGTRLVTGGRAGRKGQPAQRTYRCTKVPGGVQGCGGVSALALPVEEVVEMYAQRLILSPAVRARASALRGEASETVAEVTALEDRIRELDAQLEQPGVPVATILRARERAQDRLDDALKALASAGPSTLPNSAVDWPADLGRRRALVEVVVDKVHLDPATRTGIWQPERVRIDPR